jgi:chemotaxis protein MotB
MAKKSRTHNHDEHIDESWLIPYADILTLLLALFIVLFASSTVDAQKFEDIMTSFNSVLSGGPSIFETGTVVPIGPDSAKRGQEDQNDTDPQKLSELMNQKELTELQKKIQQETIELENLKEKIDAYIEDNGLNSQLTTELNSFQLVLRISDNALYSSGSATIKTEARQLAIAIAEMLGNYPQYEVVVSGHTDDRPIRTAQFSDNWDLSSSRALNFMKILLSNDALEPKRFSAIGFGEYQPVETNTTDAGRAANRRVEVSIIRNIVEAQTDTVEVNQ